jgi:hypothetical protein
MMDAFRFACVLLAAATSALGEPPAADPDTDGDGLSDFQEIHKYLTDPAKKDSDGDGTTDGDPRERREYTYTVRSLMHVIKPINAATLTDDYQDGRVLEEAPDHVKIEVISYPLNTSGASIGERAAWRAEYAADQKLAACLKPGGTANFDDAMQKDIIATLKADGIDVEKLSDRAAAQQVSHWLLKRVNVEDSFTTFGVEFVDAKPRVAPALQGRAEDELRRRGRTIEEQWDRELLGAGMYRTKTMGSCTSAAIYLSTCLKAVGLPTRTIIVVPVLDGNDDTEHALAAKLTNHRVKRIIEKAAAEQKGSWTSHTFNEVYVDGRWRRLNSNRLGQNILDEGGLGLMIHVNTYIDHAEAGLLPWGLRDAKEAKNDVCGYGNPYSCIELSDQFGVHSKLENAVAPVGLERLTISKMYWYDDPAKDPSVSMRLDNAENAGHLLVHVDEDAPSSADYRAWYESVGKEFKLRAAGRPDVRAVATRGYWIDMGRGIREFYLQVPPEDLKTMEAGVRYELAGPAPDAGKAGWVVKDGVGIVRRK